MSEKNMKQPGKMAGLLVQIKKIFGLNIATVAFGILLIYMLFTAVLFLTSSHIESYQVSSGPLSRNETYTGLSLREETVCKSQSSGYINYYAREGSKINAGGAVYGLSSGKISESQTALSTEELSKVRNTMLSFSKSFSPSKFNSTYSFKNQLEGDILQYEGVTDNVSSSAVTIGNQNICKAQTDGIILYSIDGYEGKTIDTITAEDFDQNSYHETDLKTDQQIQTGDNVYTNITSELWSLIIPLSDKQAAKLKDRSTIRVKFLKDNMTQSGDFSIVKIDGSKYGKIDFSRGLIRYASDRFLDIELVTNTVTGLKIPLSAIDTKDFYVIPAAYATVDPDSLSVGFNKISKDSDGNSVRTFVQATIYGKTEDKASTDSNGNISYNYYVDKTAFKEGDAIVKDGSSERFIISTSASLEGVYCINQGYAVFRQVEILDQNEEYAIVSSQTSYGLSRYDRIVRKASQVNEQDILY